MSEKVAKEAANKDCERVWATRRIRMWREDPRKGEKGTDLVVGWIEPWMRHHRKAVTEAKPSKLPDPILLATENSRRIAGISTAAAAMARGSLHGTRKLLR